MWLLCCNCWQFVEYCSVERILLWPVHHISVHLVLFCVRHLSSVFSLLVEARGYFHKLICCLYLSAATHEHREHGCHISEPMSHLPGSDRHPSCFELKNVCQCHSWAAFTVKAEVYEFRFLLRSAQKERMCKNVLLSDRTKTSFFQTEHPDVCCSAPWSLKPGRKQDLNAGFCLCGTFHYSEIISEKVELGYEGSGRI